MQENKQYYLGIDGGGTKTALVLADSQGLVVRKLFTEGCNPIDVGIERTKQILLKAIDEICGQIPRGSICCFAGIAGGSSGNMQAQLTLFLGGLGFCASKVDSDTMNIIAAGLKGRTGIAMIMGTGIIAFIQSEAGLSRVAGWGYYFDNGGSAYNVGRDGISAYYCALDGSGAATALTDKVNCWAKENLIAESKDTEEASIPIHQLLLGELYAGGKKRIASFAPMVFEAAQEGDPIAKAIIRRNMAQAAHVIETAGAKLKGIKHQAPIPVVIAGGLTNQKKLLNYLTEQLPNPGNYQLEILSCEPVMGAICLAKELSV